ncbi:MAG TPA: hypothetical protein VH092_16200 [Urbifossiella sp.]|nr:hypothetical protein [Urbifossiella sp.]
MNARRNPSVSSRPRPTSPSSLLLQSSTAGWFAEWKARKQAAPSSTNEPHAPPAEDAAEAVAKWLTGDKK